MQGERPPSRRPATLPELEQLLARACDGCPEAIQEMLEHWAPALLSVIRRRLDDTPRLRTLFDTADFLQEVGLTLHQKRVNPKVFTSLRTFFAFVQAVALNKVREFQRKWLWTEKSSLNHEGPLEQVFLEEVREPVVPEAPAGEGSLEEEEQFEHLLQGHPSHHQRIVQLLRAGHSFQAIAGEMQLHEKTVRRLVVRLVSDMRSRISAVREGD